MLIIVVLLYKRQYWLFKIEIYYNGMGNMRTGKMHCCSPWKSNEQSYFVGKGGIPLSFRLVSSSSSPHQPHQRKWRLSNAKLYSMLPFRLLSLIMYESERDNNEKVTMKWWDPICSMKSIMCTIVLQLLISFFLFKPTGKGRKKQKEIKKLSLLVLPFYGIGCLQA